MAVVGIGGLLYAGFIVLAIGRSCHAIFLPESDSQVNVNCVLDDDGFLDACCSKRLTFSCPLNAVEERETAFAMAVDIIPCSDTAREPGSRESVIRIYSVGRALVTSGVKSSCRREILLV